MHARTHAHVHAVYVCLTNQKIMHIDILSQIFLDNTHPTVQGKSKNSFDYA